ncbi:MAG: hypothetical protein J07HQX50_01667 [Haloquadratum sp. J07HQX50]|nr:MAG: hypothetical protein J07HQX50_01667 [Haloquadratum sp. J07HQX50]
MCKQQRVERETYVGQITKIGFDATRRLIPREIVDKNEKRDEDVHVRLVEASLLLTFTSKLNTVLIITHCT